jgi:CheY-like chemotaxis protein
MDQPNVLVVEDIDTAQVAALAILESLHCRVTLAGTGQQAIARATETPFDAIFMDLGLPDVDVLTVTETIRQSSHNSETPIIALTAFDDASIRQHCAQAGMTSFLVKPLTREKATEALTIGVTQ